MITTSEIYDTLLADIRASLEADDMPLYQKSFVRVLCIALAGVLTLYYRFAAALSSDFFPQKATYGKVSYNGKEYNPLALLLTKHRIDPQTPNTPCRATISLVWTSAGTVPQNTFFTGKSNRCKYVTETSITRSEAGTSMVSVICIEDARKNPNPGEIGSLSVGDVLTMDATLSFIPGAASVVEILQTAEDGETEAEYRQRGIDGICGRPRGGALEDFRQWAIMSPGITAAYPYPKLGSVAATSSDGGSTTLACTVAVYCTTASGAPTAAQLAEVQQNLLYKVRNGELFASRSPAHVLPVALPCTTVLFNVTIRSVVGLSGDVLAEVQSRVLTFLTTYFQSREPYIPGISSRKPKDIITAAYIYGIVQKVIGEASGYAGAIDVTFAATAAQLDVYQLTEGELSALGGIVWA